MALDGRTQAVASRTRLEEATEQSEHRARSGLGSGWYILPFVILGIAVWVLIILGIRSALGW